MSRQPTPGLAPQADEWVLFKPGGLGASSPGSLAPEVRQGHLYIRNNLKAWIPSVRRKVVGILGVSEP